MNRRFLFKVGIITGLMLILLLPLGMIEGVIGERSAYRYQAKESIAQSWTGAQKFLGPVMVVPYLEHHEKKIWNEEKKAYEIEKYTESRSVYLLPEQLLVTGDVTTEERSRGIYAIPVYDAKLKVQGRFNNEALLETTKTAKVPLEWQQPLLSVAVTDIRGIVTQPQLNWQGATIEFLSGSKLGQENGGMHAQLSVVDATTPASYPFEFAVDLHGMETLEFAPLGKSTEVRLSSDWPHPSFVGRYLPTERELTESAFTATWLVSSFSSDMSSALDGLMRGDSGLFFHNTFGVSLVNPVDVYQQTERSVKYGILFLLLTFTAFFLFEVTKGLRLHPMQYLLVGTAITMFYLLLVSLSEHLPFELAYPIAAFACAGLIGVYISEVLKSRKRGLGFSGALLLLYAMLFAILRSEDNALLMGSLLIFGVLSGVMLVTRRLDWYVVADQMAQQAVLARAPTVKEEVQS